jgi:hypothetical protein
LQQKNLFLCATAFCLYDAQVDVPAVQLDGALRPVVVK